MRASVKSQVHTTGTHCASRSGPLVSWSSPQRRGTAPAPSSAGGRVWGAAPRINRSSCGARLRPNTSLNHRTPNGRLSWPGLAVRGTFSPARAKPSRRRWPVSSNVRPRRETHVESQQNQRLSAWAKQPRNCKAATTRNRTERCSAEDLARLCAYRHRKPRRYASVAYRISQLRP